MANDKPRAVHLRDGHNPDAPACHAFAPNSALTDNPDEVTCGTCKIILKNRAKKQTPVWVVMGNDYPEAVFTTESKAEEFCQKMKEQQKGEQRRIYWRSYKFILNRDPTE